MSTASVTPAKTIGQSPAPRGKLEGVYYKVQLEAVDKYVPTDSKYQIAQTLGALEIEPITEKNLQRVLLGNFRDKEVANEVAKKMRASSQFPQAYVVKYHHGKRIN